MIRKLDLDAFKSRVRAGVEEALARHFARHADTEVRRVAQYAVIGGGHRWRAMAAIAAGAVFRDDAWDATMPCACSAELVHAASLVLDDLPSMDDAALRRGRPCAHLVFPRWAVDMAPVYLVNLGYEIALQNPLMSPELRVRVALEGGAAAMDMFRGQEIDLTRAVDGIDLPGLLECYRLKTGAPCAYGAKSGALACGAGDEDAQALYECGGEFGVAYQILDDVADVTERADGVGKNAGMDAGRITAVDLLGVEGATARAREIEESAIARLARFGAPARLLRSLIRHATSVAP